LIRADFNFYYNQKLINKQIYSQNNEISHYGKNKFGVIAHGYAVENNRWHFWLWARSWA